MRPRRRSRSRASPGRGRRSPPRALRATQTPPAAFWVGLGGYATTSQALEQIGTDADCSRSGKPTYYAWYELVPEPPVNLKTFKINAGDTITTSVNVTGSTVLLQLKNRTRGTVFTKRVTTSNLDLTSAEWIAEAPSSCTSGGCTPVPLANFGNVAFSRIATIGNAHGGTLTDPSWSAVPIQLVPKARGGGFFPGPERGYVTQNSTAGTSLPVGLPIGRPVRPLLGLRCCSKAFTICPGVSNADLQRLLAGRLTRGYERVGDRVGLDRRDHPGRPVPAHIVPAPVEEDGDAVAKADDVVQVHGEPGDPAEKAGQLEAEDVRDGSVVRPITAIVPLSL